MRPVWQEEPSLWERLQSVQKPLVLYGMGDGADKLFAALGELGLTPSGVFASDDFVRGRQQVFSVLS